MDYPRSGRTGFLRWVPSWRQILSLFLLAALAVVGFVIWAYASTDIPRPDQFAEAQNTTVFYADGTEMGTFGVQNRVLVAGDEISQAMKDAIVAAEDRSFYENPGIDPMGIGRAFWNNLRGGGRQGGSTITQQYAERYYFGETQTSYWEKFQEALLAVKLDRAQDKDEILENYLNTIFFGRGSFGIETAAQSYFGIPAAELTVEQAAVIAGVVPSPNNWDPRVNPERAEQRWNYVMDGMVVTGAMTQAERDAATRPETIEWNRSDRLAGPVGYLLDMVRREILDRSPITEEELETRGYAITTTIDPAMQDSIVETAQGLPEDAPENLRVAMVTLAPQDGAILALYGGPDFIEVSRNAVMQDEAQAGSTFKPFTLAAYLQDGGSLRSRYSGQSPARLDDWDAEAGLQNYGNQSFGEVDVLRATEASINTVYAQMNLEIGPERTVGAAIAAGLREETTGLRPLPSNVLGVASPRPIDLARGFNTFAAQGMRTQPFIVRTVEYLDGGTVYQGEQVAERAFDADVVADLTFALRQVIENGSGTRASIGRPAAGKTGTSSDNKSAWFIGYVPQLTTAVGLYQVSADGTTEEEITPFGGFREITGGSIPAQLWATHMQRATEGMEVQDFPSRADVGEPNKPPVISVPDVVGMSQDEATSTLESAGFSVSVDTDNHPDVPEGDVFAQGVSGQAERGTTVTISVSQGPGSQSVPGVVGQNEDAARRALEDAGFSVSVDRREGDAPEGRVLSQNPSGGADGEPGSTVTIVVSTGPPQRPEPTQPPPESPEPTEEPEPGDGDGDDEEPGQPGQPGQPGDPGRGD